MQVIVQDLMVHYETHGHGPVMLWLHGWASSGDIFKPLARQLDGYTHVLLDLPGFGKSQLPNGGWSLQDYAQFTHDFCAKLALHPKVLVAHSYGGAVSVVALASQQLSAKKLVLLGAAGVRDTEVQNVRRSIFKVVAKIGKMFTLLLPAELKHRLRKRLYKAAGSDMLVHEAMSETFKKSTTQDVLGIARKVEVPTLLVYGEADKETPVRFGQLFKQAIPNAELEVIEAAGHFVFLDQPAAVLLAMKSFLNDRATTAVKHEKQATKGQA